MKTQKMHGWDFSFDIPEIQSWRTEKFYLEIKLPECGGETDRYRIQLVSVSDDIGGWNQG